MVEDETTEHDGDAGANADLVGQGDIPDKKRFLPFYFEKIPVDSSKQMMELVNLEMPSRDSGDSKAVLPQVPAKLLRPSKKRKVEKKSAAFVPQLTFNIEPLVVEDAVTTKQGIGRTALWGDEIERMMHAPFAVLAKHGLSSAMDYDKIERIVRIILKYQYSGELKYAQHDKAQHIALKKWSVVVPHIKAAVIKMHPHGFRHSVLTELHEQVAKTGDSESFHLTALLSELDFEKKEVGPTNDDEEMSDAGADLQRAKQYANLLRDETMMLKLTRFALDSKLDTRWGFQMQDLQCQPS